MFGELFQKLKKSVYAVSPLDYMSSADKTEPFMAVVKEQVSVLSVHNNIGDVLCVLPDTRGFRVKISGDIPGTKVDVGDREAGTIELTANIGRVKLN
ncbi:MAG: hypothetical protein BGN88_13065 [Clostridiales bacterium 43-6]|nr:MAG: hypothetical protein BGN88_13065 [Clostridiales bacterium 43-6]